VPEETDTGMGTSISETLLVWAKTETEIKNRAETTTRAFLMKINFIRVVKFVSNEDKKFELANSHKIISYLSRQAAKWFCHTLH
jgi:hypothetical protein